MQQVGKLSNERMTIRDEDKLSFAWYLRDELVKQNILKGEVIKIWSEKQVNKIEEMMDTTKAKFDVKTLTQHLIY